MQPAPDKQARATYARLLRYSLSHWKALIFAIAGMLVFAATSTGFAALMHPLIDGSFVAKDPAMIRRVPFMIIGLFLLRGIANFISSYGMNWIGREIIHDLRHAIFSKFLQLPTRYYDQHSSGSLISKLTYDVEQVNQAATNVLANVVRDGFTVIGLLIWMAYVSWVLAIVFFVAAPPIVLLMARVNRRFRQISRRIQGSMGEITAVGEEAISGQRIVKIFGGQAYESERFKRINEINRRFYIKMTSASATSMALIEFIAATALAGIIYLATLPSMLASVTVGKFVSFVVAVMLLMPSIKRLLTVMPMVQKGVAAADSIFTLLDHEEERDSGVEQLMQVHGAVEFRGVSFAYDTKKGDVLHHIDLSIRPGQCVALVGRSGGGKSTLASLLPRLYDAEGGTVLLDGIDIRAVRLLDLRKQIAWVGQDVTLFDDTIGRNIAYGALGQVPERDIVRAAEAAHAMEFITRLPEGLHTMVGGRGMLLSGGQRQRLAIARALLKNAPILILDEATSALDSESERHIQAALAEVMRNRTTLVIAHRLSTIENADLIVVLEQGRIVEQGSHQELLSLGGHYAALYRLQFRGAQILPFSSPSLAVP